jgi:hypothetical protein
MENIIQPKTEAPEEVKQQLPQDMVDAGVDLKNIEFLSYFGLKHEMFDRDVVSKVKEVAEFVGDVEKLRDFDLRLGNPYGVSRLDKVYMNVQLLKQEQEIKQKQELIDKEKSKYYV